MFRNARLQRPEGLCNTSSTLSLISGFARRFAKSQDGSLTIFGVYMFLIMVMVAGIGVDMMRYERDRTKLQNTLDRAVLAAADLDQPLEPQAVVNDYFKKAGMSDFLATVTVTEGLNYREVSASATRTVETQFMHMNGVDELLAPAAGTAEERIDGVEISLVLDVSGSMNSNSRLPNLKVAAKDFVDEMVENTEDGKLSISIIPYATQVSVGAEILDQFNISDEHSYSHCVNFEASDFNRTEITQSESLERTMHFDVWDDFDGRDNDPVELVRRPICEDDHRRVILPLQKDADVLKDFIDDLWADGNTSLDIGMKWGTALLDPSLQNVVDELIDNGTVSNDFGARPHDYQDNETIKVLVLMTDGQNTSQYYINDGYRTGNSNLWWNEEEERYSVYVPFYNSYYWPHTDDWEDHAYGNGGGERYCAWYRYGVCRSWRTRPEEPGEAVQLTYPELWAYTSMERNVEDHYEPWMNDSQAWSDWYYAVRNYVGYSVKDARTRSICSAAKSSQIIVFTIGFEAPDRGNAVLQDCASSVSHHFDVDGLEISDAFSAIASSIRQLRLTQ